MNADFRSEPSDSPEGKGKARNAWDAYVRMSTRVAEPLIRPAVSRYARRWTMDQLGFWMAWHLYGGFEGLVENAGVHPSTVWRRVAKFRKHFGEHPDTYEFPGVTIDPEEFWAAATADVSTDEGTEA